MTPTPHLPPLPPGPVAAPSSRFDVAIMGGGAVGLATAMALANDYHASIIVVEAECSLAAHQTGNNSGVIHSGLYYKPGSLRATLCTQGRNALYQFCQEHSIPHDNCGKVVVATSDDELPALDELLRRGIANGLADLRRLSIDELREHEPHVAGIAGLFVRETGIVDYKALANAYADVVRQAGGHVRTSAQVRHVTPTPNAIILHTTQGDFSAQGLINCAGLQSDRVARMCGLKPDARIVPFRGEYYRLAPDAWRFCKNLIYPVPNPAFPFLGVHFTRIIAGGVEAGPNAVLALARHGYSWTRLSPRDLLDTLTFPGFWRMARKCWKAGLGEIHRSLSKNAFLKALQRLMPELESKHLAPGGAGIRAQALDRTGNLLDDFAIQTAPRMIHVLNAPSPAATASISIGRYIAQTASSLLDLPQLRPR